MSAADINPAMDALTEYARVAYSGSERTAVESILLLLRVTLLNIDRIADALESIAVTERDRFVGEVRR